MSDSARPDVYGNITKPQRQGIFGVPMGVMAIGAVVVIFIVLMMVRHLYLPALGVAMVGVVAAALTMFRGRDGRNFYERNATKAMHAQRVRSGNAMYFAGPAGRVPDGKMRLPGLMAASELSSHLGAYDIPFGLIYNRPAKHYTVVLEAFPDGDALVDQDRVNSMVAHWGAWLAELGRDDAIVGASVTVETTPDTGFRLNRMVQNNISENGSDFARAVAERIPQQLRGGAPVLTTRIAITFSGAGYDKEGSDRGLKTMAQEIGTRLPSLISGLHETGAGTTVRPCSAQDITDFTRSAFDPTVAAQIEAARSTDEGTGLGWHDAGPVFHDARNPDRYYHDRAVSKSWEMHAGPQGHFQSGVLRGLLAPNNDPAILRKRVTLLYRPIPAGDVVSTTQADVNNATFSASSRQRQTAGQRARVRYAEKASEEVQMGAGLVRFGLVVTITCGSSDEFPRLEKAIPGLSRRAGLAIREALGAQEVAFQTGLPLGLVLPAHSLVPDVVRTWL